MEGYQKVIPHVLNPKALSLNELYGSYNLETREWTDGVLSVVMRDICADEKLDEKWLVLDGPSRIPKQNPAFFAPRSLCGALLMPQVSSGSLLSRR